VVLGTKPILLSPFSSGGQRHVFAASDRPTIIYSNNKKLLYSNLNENDVAYLASFSTSSLPDSLALVKANHLSLGTIDGEQIAPFHAATFCSHADDSPKCVVTPKSSELP
jgi:DNA damage-binding protein 1